MKRKERLLVDQSLDSQTDGLAVGEDHSSASPKETGCIHLIIIYDQTNQRNADSLKESPQIFFYHRLNRIYLYDIYMQQLPLIPPKPTQIYDVKSQSYLSISNGQLQARHSEGFLPPQNLPASQIKQTHRAYLKFVRPPNSHIVLDPTGTFLLCKSAHIQQVDTNWTISQGAAIWSVFVANPQLTFAVGVRDTTSKAHSIFDFSLKSTAILTFKVDLEELNFKCWINSHSLESKRPITLQKGHSWTPFIRIKDNGSSIVLNHFVEDPQGLISRFNIFCATSSSVDKITETVIVKEHMEVETNKQLTQLQAIDQDTLALFGEHHIKFIRREKQQEVFRLDCCNNAQNKFIVKVSQKELDFLKQAESLLNIVIFDELHHSELGGYAIAKQSEAWREWGTRICFTLDKCLKQQLFSTSLIERVYEILLCKLAQVEHLLGGTRLTNNRIDLQIIGSISNASTIPRMPLHCAVPASLTYNNWPGISVNSRILSLKHTRRYTVCLLEGKRVSLLNHEHLPFHICDFMIARGVKKETELNIYKKEAEEMAEKDPSQPHIYKILKNCLKYADKIKPPEKLLEEFEKKKKKVKEEKLQKPTTPKFKQQENIGLSSIPFITSTPMPDKELENTLISMGFNSRVARKALIECQNSTLEAAIDLIVNKYQSEAMEIMKEEEFEVTNQWQDWSCEACTYINSKASQECSICGTPAVKTKKKVETKKMEVEIKKEEPFEIVEQEIKSEAIEEDLIDVYAFETQLNYCPILLVGVFKNKIRFRLIGPNPKYYSHFYMYEESCFDLFTHTLKESADKIASKPVECLNYLYSHPTDLKERSWGWICLEDEDIPWESIVNDVKYKDQRMTILTNQGLDAGTFKVAIIPNNIYHPTKKCLKVTSEGLQPVKEKAIGHYRINQSLHLTEDVLPLSPSSKCNKSEFTLTLTKPSSKQRLDLTKIISPKPARSSLKQPLLQLFGDHYPNCKVSPTRPTISLRSLQPIHIDYIRLQRTKVVEEDHSGYVYALHDADRVPLQKYAIKFTGNKAIIQMNQQRVKYLMVAHFGLSQINYVGAYGTIEKAEDGSSEIECVAQQDISIEDSHARIEGMETFILNSPYDLGILSKEERTKTVEAQIARGEGVDLKVKVMIQADQRLDVAVRNWMVISKEERKLSVQQVDEKAILNDYQANINGYFSLHDRSCLEALLDSKYDSMHELIEKEDLSGYLINHLSQVQNDSDYRQLLTTFLKKYSEQFAKLESNFVWNECLKHGKITADGLELLMELPNIFGFLPTLQHCLNRIPLEPYEMYEDTELFSWYYHKQMTKKANCDSVVHSYILQSKQFLRKYTIDLINSYDIEEIKLKFDKTKTRNKMRVTVKSYSTQEELQCSTYFGEVFWEQLVQHSRPDTLALPIPTFTTRYLIIEVAFTLNACFGSKAEIQNIPDNQIFPLVYGKYHGESDAALANMFMIPQESLLFVKRMGELTKYSIQNQLSCCLYDREEQITKFTLPEIRKSIELPEMRDRLVKTLMKAPSSQCTNYYVTLACLILDRLSASQLTPPLLRDLTEKVLNVHQGPIYDKVMSLLMTYVNEATYLDILRCNFKDEYTLIQIFKDCLPLKCGDLLQFLKQGSFQNVYYLLKHNQEDNLITRDSSLKSLLQTVSNRCEAVHKREWTMELIKKYGWTPNTPSLLDSIEDLDDILAIIKCSQEPIQIIKYAETCFTNRNYDTLWLCLQQLPSQPHSLESLFKHLMEAIEKQTQAQHDLFKKLIQFVNVIGMTPEGGNQIIDLYFNLHDKLDLFCQFMNLRLLSNPLHHPSLIQKTLSFLECSLGRPHSLACLHIIRELFDLTLRKHSATHTPPSTLLILTEFLLSKVNVGGVENAKIASVQVAEYISIGFYLSELLQHNPQTIPSPNKLIHWCILNINTSEESIATYKSQSVNRFLTLEKNMWSALLHLLPASMPTLMQVYEEVLMDIAKVNNPCLKAIYLKKVHFFMLKLSQQPSLLKTLIGEHRLLERVFKEISEMRGVQELIPLEEQELANTLELPNKPKDWLVYKNGAKNSVYSVDEYVDRVARLTFTAPKPFTLTKLLIGFECSVNVPKEILLQSENNIIGKLVQIPDDHYMNHSVRVFGISIALNTPSVAAFSRKHSPLRVLTIVLKCSDSISISDVLCTDNPNLTNLSTRINFLSVQGYSTASLQPQPLIDLLLLTESHSTLMEEVFNRDSTVKAYNNCLQSISLLMNNAKFERPLHNFLMKVCSYNTSIGNTMLTEYLSLTNPYLNAKIAAEIVLSNPKEYQTRVPIFFNFLNCKIEQKNLLPFLSRFTQIASILGKCMQKCGIDLKASPSMLKKLLCVGQKSVVELKFMHRLLSSEYPKVQGIPVEQILESLFLQKREQQLLASLVLQYHWKWFIRNNYLTTIFESTITLIQTNQSVEEINSNLKFLSLISLNSQIKALINSNQYNLKILEILICQKYKVMLSEEKNATLRGSLVSFITKSSLGTENQRIIGALLKDSLLSVFQQGNHKFVSEVFLPLLNSYSKVYICVLPYHSQQRTLITDITNLTHTAPPVPIVRDSKLRLPSIILTPEHKLNILSKLTGIEGSFNLIASHNTFLSRSTLEQIKTKLASNRSFLVCFQLKSKSKETTLVMYYNGAPKRINAYMKMKSKMAHGCALGFTEGSFVLALEGSKEFYVNSSTGEVTGEANSSNGEQFLDIQEEHGELSLNITANGSKIAHIPFNDQVFLAHNFNLAVLNGSTEQQYISSGQYWVLEMSTPPTVGLPPNSCTRNLLSQFNQVSYFPKEFKADKALQLMRYESVYEFPSSITLRQLKSVLEIMNSPLQKGVELTSFDKVYQDVTPLEQLHPNNVIVDLLFSFDKIVEFLNFKAINSTTLPQFLPRKNILKYFEENDGVSSMIKVIRKSIQTWKMPGRKAKWTQYMIELETFSTFPHFFEMYLKDKETFTLMFSLLSGVPDNDPSSNWDEMEASSSLKLLKIVANILQLDKSSQFRNNAVKNDFFGTLLDRLQLLTGIFKRKYSKEVAQEKEQVSPSKINNDDEKKEVKKKKGVGYGNQVESDTKWMKGEMFSNVKKEFEVIEIILSMVENFLDAVSWRIPAQLLTSIMESALLPYVQDCLRAGTLLQISKHPEKIKAILRIVKVLAKNKFLVPCLLPIKENYQPKQSESIESLLKSLDNTSKIFKSCLTQSKSKEDKISEELANLIIEVYAQVQDAISDSLGESVENQSQLILQKTLLLPLPQKYRILLKDLRFDYIDMKESPNRIKHHYSSSFNVSYTPNQNKMIRLAQQLADISTALPFEHTNGVYVRCDKDRVDFMQALIMGSNGTPYGHGAYLFDIYFEDTYPNVPPKVNLTTTGHGKIRFNPNLYSCGKVCLSLLGTWRGSASENWDAKVSTLLQVLLSIQAIIMSEQVYFNEPGFENEQGTDEGEKKNEAYSNIVRYGNVKFAMTENIKNPPKGFEAVIRRHFYLKKEQIMEQCKKWLKNAEKHQANYVGLVNDHNVSWATEFKKSKTQYKEMMEKAVKQLEEELNKLPPPSLSDIVIKNVQKKEKKKVQNKDLLQEMQAVKKEEIDVGYEKDLKGEGKEMDINDEKVKDRWSRYIGAMGIDAVSKQSKADILVFGLNPMGLEAVKNLVLSGCRKMTICDSNLIKPEDLSGGFFYEEQDIGKKRIDCILYKIRELNAYVKIDTISEDKITQEIIMTYSIVLATELPLTKLLPISRMCRKHNVKYVVADCNGAYCRLINDFTDSFEVLDKNGEEPVEVIIKDITCAEKAVVTLLDGSKHPFEDGEAIVIDRVEGMKSLENIEKSINGTVSQVKVINSKSFSIGSTLGYEKYVRNGTAKNIKTPLILKYKPLELLFEDCKQSVSFEQNMETYDFIKMGNGAVLHFAFLAVDKFTETKQKLPQAWKIEDAEQVFQIFKEYYKQQINVKIEKFVKIFSMTFRGYLPPLCAFFGGFVAQEVIKGITQKFKPVHSMFYAQFSEIIPQLPEEPKEWKEETFKEFVSEGLQRDIGLSTVVGQEVVRAIKDAKLFMIGAGAIGCELLKNFAMVGLGTGKDGKITLTDPDHIQNSNLNRQFLFRQKHISKSKSRTAAASILLMNPHLKGHISALEERVSDSTKGIFSNAFFETRTIVANALDNVAARRYVDQRCVENKVPLFESGTLGPKGHVQVILPYLTESYGSQNDPAEEGQIPHCTLKMFPEETLHCIEWARDKFGKKFSLQPKALAKVLDKNYKPEKDDIKALNESLVMVQKGPKCFQDCIEYAVHKFYQYFRNDVMQLLYTYPLDVKTKNGEPFWKLPKRPPVPIMEFNPEDLLQSTFVSVLAVLLAKLYNLPHPSNFRSDKERIEIGKVGAKVKIAPFTPSDEKSKEIMKESANEQKKKDQAEQKDTVAQQSIEKLSEKSEHQIYKQLLSASKGHDYIIKPEEFEKDNDGNGHIDFIYSMANLRARNYKLDPMDWITTKIKAGRIVPALATTTSCIAGLQTLQICKFIRKTKFDQMRNAYINLAVPSLQMSEPGEVMKKKISDKLTVTLWDRWEVQCKEDFTFADLYSILTKRYDLLTVGVLQGMSRLDTGSKEEFLKTKLLERMEKEQYVDIIVLFAKTNEPDKILEGMPPVRLVFK